MNNKTPDLHLHQIWLLKLEKWIEEFQNWSPHSMVHYAHIWRGRTSTIELVEDLRAASALGLFQNDPESLLTLANGDFPCAMDKQILALPLCEIW